MWSYTFTDYDNFSTQPNAVIPRPKWPPGFINADVPVSTTPPLNETDYNAMEFSLWRQFGRQILIKSNINNWIVCSTGKGSFVDWQDGSVACTITKRVNSMCSDGTPPSTFITGTVNWCGPMFRGGKDLSLYYYFDSCTGRHYPTHDPCGNNQDNGLKNVENPYGNIFVR